MDEYDYTLLDQAAEEQKISKGELLRRALLTIRVLYDPDLTVGKALTTCDPDTPLCVALRPIPELAGLVGLDLKVWKSLREKKNKNSL
ncbi:MAG: hypothetical protein QXV39_07970 [Candidatus Caldarchaeum sp.]